MQRKGNIDCHIPNKSYRANYDNVFKKDKPRCWECSEELTKLSSGNLGCIICGHIIEVKKNGKD